MKTIITLLLLCVLGNAAELILPNPPYLYTDGVLTENSHGYASLCVGTPTGVSTNIGFWFDSDAQWQSTHVLRYRTGISAGSATGTLCMPIQGLAGNTLYRVCPSMTAGNGDATNCTNTGTDPNRFFTFSTPPTPAVDPVPPTRADVSDFDTTYPADTPAIGAGTGAGDFAVLSDCSNLNTAFFNADAYTASHSHTAAVTIPAGTVCSGGNLPAIPTRTSTFWIVFRTGGEASLPPPGTRVTRSGYASFMATMKVTSANVGFITNDGLVNSKVRFVGIRIIFDDGTAIANAGNPTWFQAMLWKVETPTSWIIFDRCLFDGQGYPHRLQYGIYITGASNLDHLAVIDSDFEDIYNWTGWSSQMTLNGASTSVLNSTATFYVGRGNITATIAPFSITWNDTTSATGVFYVMPDGSLHFGYSNAGSSVSCSGSLAGNCTPSTVIPATGTSITTTDSRFTPTITSGQWFSFGTNSDCPGDHHYYYFWGPCATGDGMFSGGEVNGNSYAITSDFVVATPNINEIIIRNNQINASGIHVFFSSFGITTNILVNRNTFNGIPACFMPNPIDTASNGHPFSCDNRYPFEVKNCHFCDFTGNTVTQNFEARGNDSGWFSLKPDVITTPGAYTGNVYVADNYATNVVGCWYVSTEVNANDGGIWLDPKVVRQVQISDNFCQSNAWANSSYWEGPGALNGVPHHGYSLMDQGAVDVGVFHNTIFDQSGPSPGVGIAEAFAHAVAYNNNVFAYQQLGVGNTHEFRGFSSGYYGSGRWSLCTIPDMGCNVTQEGTAALNVSIPTLGPASAGISWQWNNVMVPACVDSSTGNCLASTSGAGLIDSSTLSGSYPATNYWPTGSTLGGRYQTVQWNSWANGTLASVFNPYQIRANTTSSYVSGGHLSTDGLDMGFDADANAAARGVVSNVRVLAIGPSSATVAFLAPDSVGCSVDWSTNNFATFTRVSNAGGSRVQNVTLSGLSAATPYQYRGNCAQQFSGSFTTR